MIDRPSWIDFGYVGGDWGEVQNVVKRSASELIRKSVELLANMHEIIRNFHLCATFGSHFSNQ